MSGLNINIPSGDIDFSATNSHDFNWHSYCIDGESSIFINRENYSVFLNEHFSRKWGIFRAIRSIFSDIFLKAIKNEFYWP